VGYSPQGTRERSELYRLMPTHAPLCRVVPLRFVRPLGAR